MNATDLLAKARALGWPTSSIQVLADTQAGHDAVDLDGPPQLARPYVPLPRTTPRSRWRLVGDLYDDLAC